MDKAKTSGQLEKDQNDKTSDKSNDKDYHEFWTKKDEVVNQNK